MAFRSVFTKAAHVEHSAVNLGVGSVCNFHFAIWRSVFGTDPVHTWRGNHSPPKWSPKTTQLRNLNQDSKPSTPSQSKRPQDPPTALDSTALARGSFRAAVRERRSMTARRTVGSKWQPFRKEGCQPPRNLDVRNLLVVDSFTPRLRGSSQCVRWVRISFFRVINTYIYIYIATYCT